MIRITHLLAGILMTTCLGSQNSLAQDGPVVADRADATQPLKAGARIPDVSLSDASGEGISLNSLHQDKPVVLVFFRGGWCPICTRHTQQLIKIYPQIKEMGAELVGISPDSPESSKQNATKNTIPFPVLSDADVSAAKAFGLAFQVDQATVGRYKGFGIDLEKASGYSHHALPIPAVYIVDRSGKIAYAHSNPDYRDRLAPKTIIDELQKLK